MSARERSAERAKAALARRSALMVRFFDRAFAHSLKSDFHAVRLSRAGPPPGAHAQKLVVYLNHPSWWDAVICVFVAKRLFPGLLFRAPIDAAMLTRYRFMARIGMFGIAIGTRRGAADFMAVCRELFQDPRNLLMITAQGRFADVRERPLGVETGIAHLADLDPEIQFMPLAVDYCFWMERQAEVLLRFGPPIPAAKLQALSIAERRDRLEAALEETMTALAAEALARDEGAFDTLLAGKRGVHPLYDAWRRLLALARGRRFDPQHGAAPE